MVTNLIEYEHGSAVFIPAAYRGHLGIIEWAFDADFNSRGYYNLMNKAVQSGNIELVKYLRSKEIPWNRETFYSAISSENTELFHISWKVDAPMIIPGYVTMQRN